MSVFRFSESPIQPASLRESLADPACGGFVAFEGWVRDHNEGRQVLRLEYEAYEALGIKEAKAIVAEAMDRYPIRRALGMHRVGALAIGDLAVWVGVAAPHRDEAFGACRYLIDQIKTRVPIWKKEHYTDGDSGWVNCEACSAHVHDR